MRNNLSLLIALLGSLLLVQCSTGISKHTEEGVSKELALYRKSMVNNPEYTLKLEIPSEIESVVNGSLIIDFEMKSTGRVILDFTPGENAIKSVTLNGKEPKYHFENDHLVIENGDVIKGRNSVGIEFVAGDQSLNRREDLIYTLLVPDRARTLFPCFDQPDLKGIYHLSLKVPPGWEAVANGKQKLRDTLRNDSDYAVASVNFEFEKTEPVPTYLFSFVAGKMFREKFSSKGRDIHIYHRETDLSKISQCKEIADEIFYCLEWLEDYTSIPYPFSKYDIAIIPGFQYGGMEHTGATLYADRVMFLEQSATIAEKMARTKLIAHETAHMWFGDYVTMKWFDDVWTKEVFANWFANKIVSPLYPEINHRFSFVNSYIPAAYSEDRTQGAVPIQQKLDNLKNAGLVYCNIIYNKAPVVMDMLVRKTGEELFRKGVREYLRRYAYSNATWDDLIEILDSLTEEDLESWSHVWIKEPGMPEYFAELNQGKVTTTQRDPFGKGRVWKEQLDYKVVDSAIIPNTDGMGYGSFMLDSISSDFIIKGFTSFKNGKSTLLPLLSDDVARLSLLITLNENLLRGRITPEKFTDFLITYLGNETNILLFGRGVSYLTSAYIIFALPVLKQQEVENCLWSIVQNDILPGKRSTAIKSYMTIANSPEAVNNLWKIWENPDSFKPVSLGEREVVRLAYELMLRKPEKFKEIEKIQISRISNPDRLKEFRYILPSLSRELSVRDSVFTSLADPANRSIEPWVTSSLSYLCHYTRRDSSVKYILPALELLPEIQRTGDIFFPSDWLGALLSGHNSEEALQKVQKYLDNSGDINQMLRSKILQRADHIFRAVQNK